jgi:proline racemase
MCVATVLVETGRIAMTAPETELTLEAPGGLVRARVACREGRAQRVTVLNVPCFAERLDAPLEVAGLGTLSVDLAYGGDSFVLVDAHALGFHLASDEARELAEVGVRITRAANQQLHFDTQGRTSLKAISFCQLTAALDEDAGIASGLSAVAIRPAKIDRSPCGTGCSARMAVLHARGVLKRGDRFIGRSILGSRFECRIESELDLSGRRAIVPSISGRAWITGVHQHMLDPADPWPQGYRLADTWPKPQ